MNNLTHAEAFLRCLGGEVFVFQTFTDSKKQKAKIKIEPVSGKQLDPLARVLIGTFEQHKQALETLNDRGAGIFVQINAGEKRGIRHLTGVRALFVDLDEPATAKQSIAAIQEYMPKPSMMVSSSEGKFHMYWCVTDGALDTFTSLQQQLAIKFYSDIKVKNKDRVMRLPGFKHKKCEEPHPYAMPVTVVTTDAKYELAELYKAAAKAPIMTPTSTAKTALQVKPKPNTSSDAFGLNLNEAYAKPEVLEPGDRTAKLVSHAGHMVGEGYSATAIKNELKRMNTDLCPEHATPIPEATLEIEVLGCVDKFIFERDGVKAPKGIQRLQHAPVAPACLTEEPLPDVDPIAERGDNTLDEWLDRFRYIDNGSRVIDTSHSAEYSEYTLNEFKNKSCNVRINGKATLSSKWLAHPGRQDFRDTTFIPKEASIIEDAGALLWNMYRPSSLKPVDKDDYDEDMIAPFIQHLEYFFPKKKDRTLFMNWFVVTVMNPELRIPWAPLIVSDQGAGKGWIYEVLKMLLGRHNCAMIKPERLEHQFNSFMVRNTLVCVDEMKTKNKYGVSDNFKSYISEPTLEINMKGITEKQHDIYCNFLVFTNHHNAAVVEQGDRRFWVYKVMGVQTADYYIALWKWLRGSKGINHLLRWCIEYDIGSFKYAAPPPETLAKRDMTQASRGEFETELRDAIEGRIGPFAADIVSWTVVADYISLLCSAAITGKVYTMLRATWGDVAEPLSNASNPMRCVDGSEGRHRVRCVRNYKYWEKQDLDAIKYEMTRSVQMQLNKKDVLPPMLTKVPAKGERNR